MVLTLSVHARLPISASNRPPLLFIHGAANAGGVWFRWQELMAERGWATYAVDLRGHGGSSQVDMARVTMDDYVEDVEAVVSQLGLLPVIIGWSMGGLVAQMYLARHPEARAGVLLAPSTPSAVQRGATPEQIAAIPDTFGSEYYGIDLNHPTGGRALAELSPEAARRVLATLGQESGAARRQRLRGIDIPARSIRCPLLVVHGDGDRQFPPELCQRVADYYNAETLLAAGGVGHWGVVAGPAVDSLTEKVHAWLEQRLL